MRKNILLFMILLCFVFVGCAAKPLLQPSEETTMPTAYPDSVDTTSLTEPVLTVSQPYFHPFSQKELDAARSAALEYTSAIVPEPDSSNYYNVEFIAYDPILTDTLVRQRMSTEILDQAAFFANYAAFSIYYKHLYKNAEGYEEYLEDVGYLLCQQEEGQWQVAHYSPTEGTVNIMTAQQLENFQPLGHFVAGYSKGMDGCQLYAFDPQNVTSSVTEVTSAQLLHAGKELSVEEMAVFEDLLMYDMTKPDSNWYNMALKSRFESPEQIDLFALFYSAPWGDLTLTAEELAFVKENGLNPEISFIHKYPAEKMNAVLLQHFGIALDQTDKNGLAQFLYYPDTDCYFHMHGDITMGYPEFLKGIRTGDDKIIIFYEALSFVFGMQDYEVTLAQQEDGTYHILSNRLAGFRLAGNP